MLRKCLFVGIGLLLRFRKRSVLLSLFWLTACQEPATVEMDLVQTQDLPPISDIELPENKEAADMTRTYLSIMDKKMSIAYEIGSIYTRDQYVREVFIDMFSDPELDPGVRAAFQKAGGQYVEAIDELNTRAFKSIMKNVTWRELATQESRLADRAFSIVQHTNDDSFREAVLTEIKPLAEEGLMRGQLYALMYDRVSLKKGEPQHYGTQTECVDGKYDVVNLAEPETVDERRKILDMDPLESYLKQLRELYGPCQ